MRCEWKHRRGRKKGKEEGDGTWKDAKRRGGGVRKEK